MRNVAPNMPSKRIALTKYHVTTISLTTLAINALQFIDALNTLLKFHFKNNFHFSIDIYKKNTYTNYSRS